MMLPTVTLLFTALLSAPPTTMPEFTASLLTFPAGLGACTVSDVSPNGRHLVVSCGSPERGNQTAVLSDGAVRVLEAGPYQQLAPAAVNDAGVVAGSVGQTVPGKMTTVTYARWSPQGTLSTIPASAELGDNHRGRGIRINARNDVLINHSAGNPKLTTPYVWGGDGVLRRVTYPAGPQGTPVAGAFLPGGLADDGSVVGTVRHTAGTAHTFTFQAVRWTPTQGATVLSGLASGASAGATSMSPDGRHLRGWAEVKTPVPANAPVAFHPTGAATPLPDFPLQWTVVAVNDRGATIGTAAGCGVLAEVTTRCLEKVTVGVPNQAALSPVSILSDGRILARLGAMGSYVWLTPTHSRTS